MAGKSEAVKELEGAILAELLSDVLKVQDQLEMVKPLVTQLLEALPTSMDVLRSGVIELLEKIDGALKEAGEDQVQFVKGQLSVYIGQAIDEAFSKNSETTDKLLNQFKQHNSAAVKSLSSEFDVVISSMGAMKNDIEEMRKDINKIRMPTWVKYTLPAVFVVSILVAVVVTASFSSYREAVYADQFQKSLKDVKPK